VTAAILPPATAQAFRLESHGRDGVLHFDLAGEKVNKFSSSVLLELEQLLGELRVQSFDRLFIVSDKPGIFIAGADVTEFSKVTSREQAVEFIRYGQRLFAEVTALPYPTIAVIDGACMGGGTELALSCDWRVMTDARKAAIGLPETKLGIIPAWGGTTKLPRLVGLPAALDMILTGKTLDAKRAKRVGLVDEVVSSSIALEAAKKFAEGKAKRRGDSERLHFYLEGNPLARRIVFAKARKSTLEQTRGHYPAQMAAIDVMETGFQRGVDAGLEAEAQTAASLILGDVAKNLVSLFFLMEDAKKDFGSKPRRVERTGVLGAGLMGAGIAQAIADREVPVRLKDMSFDALAGGMRSAARVWRKKVERRRMSQAEMAVRIARITPTVDWSGFENVDLLIEAVLEKLDVKQSVLADFEARAKKDAIFATNTSTIPITAIASGARHPENVVGMHFFSPVDRMPLLEVIRGEKTSEETLATAVAFGKKLGKTVVVCNDGPGFIVNRILGPYLNEAGHLLQEGNSIESIDQAMVDFGMPLGPLELLDQVGIDVAGKAAEVLSAAFGDRLQPSELVSRALADGRLGKKNGRGIYLWTDGKRGGADPSVYAMVGGQPPKRSSKEAMQDRMVFAMINEAARILEEKIAFSAADVDLAMIFGTGFPPFRGGLLRYADARGAAEIVETMRLLVARGLERFTPSEPLQRLAAARLTFYERYPGK
jgi:3-hydroxyacyl-CoA dehydrogenase / enoyl-CoA hydratase / 3-hydroxybutyryl-CoA epimerase